MGSPPPGRRLRGRPSRARPVLRALTVVSLLALLGAASSCGDDAAAGRDGSTTTTGTDGGSGGEGDTGDTGGARPPTEGTEAPGVEGGAGARIVGRVNPDGGVPLSDGDFADPFVLDTSIIPIGYTSNTSEANVPVSRGGLRGEIELGDALPEVGRWSKEGFVWAPGVLEVSASRFVLYYTSLHAASGRECIGVAVADDPVGPFIDDREEPFVCQLLQGGSIDASPVVVDGTPYLLWKSDGNCCGLPTHVYAQQLGEDGTSLVGQAAQLITNDLDWEADVVEGPSMVDVDGTLHLFWSANHWDTGDYAVGHGRCESPLGPCVKDADPLLGASEDFQGPGGQEFFSDRAGRRWMTFHAWLPGEVGYSEGGTRRLFVEQVTFDEAGRPHVGEPS